MRLIQTIDYAAIAPPVIVALTGVVVLVADLFVGRAVRRTVAFTLSLIGALAALGTTAWLAGGSTRSTLCLPDGCSYVADDYATFFQLLFLAVAVVVLLLSVAGVEHDRMPPGEYHALLLWSVSGMLVLAAARDLLSLLIALEVVSLPAFVLVGLRRDDARSAEAALKFFLFSVVSTALTAYGIALLYGATGHLTLSGIADALGGRHAHPGAMSALSAAGVVLVLVGFAFKVSAVPFHFWTPDTYEGAPVAIAAVLSVASKAAGFAGLIVLLLRAFGDYADVWGPAVAVLAAVTMTVGNLVALRQWHLVRLLAWSTVAQAGYLLMPLGVAATAGGRSGHELHLAAQATLTYLAIYAAMNLGAFACVTAIARRFPHLAISDIRGLARRSPWLAAAFALFLTALAGLPPGVAGLFAKVVVLRAAVHGHVTWLAIVAAVNTVIGLAYYLRVAAVMFSSESDAADARASTEAVPHRRHLPTAAGIAVAVVVTVLLSVYPQPILDWAGHAATLAAPR